jgi:hypothetical protein
MVCATFWDAACSFTLVFRLGEAVAEAVSSHPNRGTATEVGKSKQLNERKNERTRKWNKKKRSKAWGHWRSSVRRFWTSLEGSLFQIGAWTFICVSFCYSVLSKLLVSTIWLILSAILSSFFYFSLGFPNSPSHSLMSLVWWKDAPSALDDVSQALWCESLVMCKFRPCELIGDATSLFRRDTASEVRTSTNRMHER